MTSREDASPPRRVDAIPWELGETAPHLRARVAESLGVSAETVAEVRVRRLSLDARKGRVRRIVRADVWLVGDIVPPEEAPVRTPPPGMKPLRPGEAPIVVGSGPAGLWAALRFVAAGQPCIVLDRGPQMKQRHRDVVDLRRRGVLHAESNLCYGEGGAGTYSDGKLYTRKRDPLVQQVYEDLVAFGAQPSIVYDAHPHIGTNRLVRVLDALRGYLLEAGCDLRFGVRADGLLVNQSGGVDGVALADGTTLTGPAVILATGHSARDVYRWLHEAGVPMERKPFAVGARCEHPQALVDRIQYGQQCGHPDLEAAAYAVKTQIGGRGVYSFCMCPGGFVIPTPTELGHLNVNGMSASTRGSDFANSALVVTLEPEDFWLDKPGDLDHHGVLAGLELQRALERRTFEAGGGGYQAPAQRLTDFADNKVSDLPSRSSYRPGVVAGDLRAVLPRRISDAIARAVHRFDQKMRGFATREALLIGVETTTSSPIRLGRDPSTLQSPGFPGLYPCGEGAGRAGGIVSSAIEGWKVAEAVLGTTSA